MPGIMIKDVPPEIHQKLKERAARNRRSMTKEALSILELVLLREEFPKQELPEPIKTNFPITDEWLDAAKRWGRE